jgi:hypothetical protein
MRSKTLSVTTLSLLFTVLVGLIVMAGCGGGSSGGGTTTPTGTPAVTLSTSTLIFSSAVNTTSASQPVTVTNSGSATLSLSGITITLGSPIFQIPTNGSTCGTSLGAGASCSISVTFTPTSATTFNGTLTITDNASNSPQTVALTGTGSSVSLSTYTLTFTNVAVNTTSASQPVTLNNNGAVAVTISSVTPTSGFNVQSSTCPISPLTLTAGGNCTINVNFAPTTASTLNGSLTIMGNFPTQTVSLTGMTTGANTAQVTVGFGPNPVTGVPGQDYYNNIFTTVTVCEPGTTTCQTINNVLLDTASVGLRVLASQLGNVILPTVTDNSGNVLNECLEFGSLDYTWGPVSMATVQIGGETASQVPTSAGGTANTGIPIQVINNSSAPTGAQCTVDYGANMNTVAILGANGLLGVGTFPNDCESGGTNSCLSSSTDNQYILCPPNANCQYASVPLQDQLWNPVAAFSSADTNGVSLTLPPISGTGAANNAITGTLTFGIGTEANNALPGTASVYELDGYGYFGSATFNGVQYTSANSYGTFLDSGSNALYVSDAATLSGAPGISVSDCIYQGVDIYYYCPSSTQTLPLEVAGTNGTSTPIDLSIADGFNLFSSGNSTFDNLGGPSCVPATNSPCNASTDSWDIGLPFFFGKTIFFGMAGTNVGNVTSTNGYYAF